ncbi:MAG: hypothetical protein K8U57_35790 [Planctomycetes bacterium]|nr:hypothetical protein [Planctomycetota bacterium]
MKYIEEHALDVAAATACYMAERLRDDLLLYSGTELHNELTIIIQTTLLAYFESAEFKSIEPSKN